ncbi:MAG: hypothetical protein U0838_00295 [Chloroflexota bacterium]
MTSTIAVRPWVAARALGITAYLLLSLEVATGVWLSHPRNSGDGNSTRAVFPWHELLTVFTGAFLALHIVLLAVDLYAGVDWIGAPTRGFSYCPVPYIGSVALYALIITSATAKWTPAPARGLVAQGPPLHGACSSHGVGARGPRGHRRLRAPAHVPADRRPRHGRHRAPLVDRAGSGPARPSRRRRHRDSPPPADAGERLGGALMSATLVGRAYPQGCSSPALTVAVLGIGLVSVQLATQWRAAAAPLDTNPVSATSISDAMAAQQQRVQTLAGQIDQVGVQVTDIRSALQAAKVPGRWPTRTGTPPTCRRSSRARSRSGDAPVTASRPPRSALRSSMRRRHGRRRTRRGHEVVVTVPSPSRGGGGGEHEGGDDD